MADRKRKWRLADLVEFEARLLASEGGDSAAERRRYREEIGKLPRWPQAEGARRRLGLRVWLEAGRSEGKPVEAGGRVLIGLRLSGILLGIAAFLAGIGLVRGLLQTSSSGLFLRGFNVWVLLATALGVQWLLLLGGLFGYLFMRRQKGTLSMVQRAVSWLTLKLSGVGEHSLPKRLLEGGAGYRSVLSWRIARLIQGVAIAFNFGLMVGLYGCLTFLSVRFYWESTFEGVGLGLNDFIEGMAFPWSWSGIAVPPAGDPEIRYAVIEKIWYEAPKVEKMWKFLLMSLLIYGMLPRLVLWSICAVRERRALATIPFQAPRHRELWRRLTKVERTLASKGQADGVVLLDVGGTDVPTERLRGFLLRELRVNPQQRFTAGVLDEEREKEALEAIGAADLGVIFLVEGWALSPKQMRVLHERVRSVGGPDLPVNFLVIGEVRGGEPSAPTDEEWEQWKAFVDSLRDPAAEAVAFGETATVGGEA